MIYDTTRVFDYLPVYRVFDDSRKTTSRGKIPPKRLSILPERRIMTLSDDEQRTIEPSKGQ